MTDLFREKRIYETWQRSVHVAATHFVQNSDVFCTVLWHPDHDVFPPDVTKPPRMEEEVIHFKLEEDGYVTCEKQVLLNWNTR